MPQQQSRHRDSKAVVPTLARKFRGMGVIVAVGAGGGALWGNPVETRWVCGLVLAFLAGWYLAAAVYDDDVP
ncbi:MAG: hypothetical protein U0837_12915 [Dehalococcoidia bacterium]